MCEHCKHSGTHPLTICVAARRAIKTGVRIKRRCIVDTPQHTPSSQHQSGGAKSMPSLPSRFSVAARFQGYFVFAYFTTHSAQPSEDESLPGRKMMIVR